MRPSGTICAKCGETLSPGARFCPSCGTPLGNTDGSRTSQPKQIIDSRYLVLQEFSRGAFGVTYLVRDMSVNMTRVLKLGPKSDAAAASRFVREANSVGVIRHPNLASVVGSSTSREGAPYLVMEHVPGPNLSQILEDGPLS